MSLTSENPLNKSAADDNDTGNHLHCDFLKLFLLIEELVFISAAVVERKAALI